MHQNFRPPAPTRRAPRRIAKRRIDKAARRKHGRPLHLCGPEPLERKVKVDLSFQVLFPSVQHFDDLLLDHSRAAASRPPATWSQLQEELERIIARFSSDSETPPAVTSNPIKRLETAKWTTEVLFGF